MHTKQKHMKIIIKIIIFVLCIFAVTASYAQTPTTITIALPTPFGDQLQKEFNLPLVDTMIVAYQQTDKGVSTYTYSIKKKNDTLYVKCLFIVNSKQSNCNFNIQLQANDGKIVPQTKKQSAIVNQR